MRIRNYKLMIYLLMLMFAVSGIFSISAYAAGNAETADYYLSYKKYVAAENPDRNKTITYNDITDQISNLLEEGLRRYESGAKKDGDEGYYKPFTNSYGFWYETSGYEKTIHPFDPPIRLPARERGPGPASPPHGGPAEMGRRLRNAPDGLELLEQIHDRHQ